MAETYLDQIERMLDEATPGPWKPMLARSVYGEQTGYQEYAGRGPWHSIIDDGHAAYAEAEADAALIAESPRALRWALGMLREYEAVCRERKALAVVGKGWQERIDRILAGPPQETTDDPR